MSISMNDHERRIKDLEDYQSDSKIKFTLLWKGMQYSDPKIQIKLSQSVLNFNAFLILHHEAGYVDYIKPTVYFVNLIEKNKFLLTIRRRCLCTLIQNGTVIELTEVYDGSPSGDCIRAVYGLKIYYIFRYNILGKFIRSINSRLIQNTQKFISYLSNLGGEKYEF